LLQGRNFSYLDTQLKRLGSPNFTDLPINAPKCPMHTFQQDGHMALVNPIGRVNYEPNSWGEEGGPRESAASGFRSFPALETGEKMRARSETFADHYSQARQFYMSQTAIEQDHIAAALAFELSKCVHPRIRKRMVAHLLNIDDELARMVAGRLGLKEMPKPATAARPTKMDLEPSPALSIMINGPDSFRGRKVGALVTDGAPSEVLLALDQALTAEGAKLELVAPTITGIVADDEELLAASKTIAGGPSVLFDAVAVIVSKSGAKELAREPVARDFIADAVAHRKLIAYVSAAEPLFRTAGVTPNLDDGFVLLKQPKDADTFVKRCRQLRYWERETLAPQSLAS
jgi:catalase